MDAVEKHYYLKLQTDKPMATVESLLTRVVQDLASRGIDVQLEEIEEATVL